MTKRILVIANEIGARDELEAAIGGPHGATQVLVVVPAVDERTARLELGSCVARLAARGLHAEGVVGDADPLHATIDALEVFAADELVIVTEPETRRLVERVAAHYDGPILHVVASRERMLTAA